MYYLMSEKNDDGNEIVYSDRRERDVGFDGVLHRFETWDAVLEYMFDPIEWKERNLGNA